MTIKTVHILDNSALAQLGASVSTEPGYDRLSEPYPPLRTVVTELIEAGEIPRYRDIESEITVTKTTTKITTIFSTRAGAEKWAAWINNDNTALVSITVVED